ncbi:MAG: hypothetical protein EA402_03360 [Planctomycetota bacterium]|nr:MAG: hypothetical protein EA402_03360 [Planctomycetota bacterium]
MKLDISRDFLDGIMLQHPQPVSGKGEVKVNAGLNFLPSSPDGKLHTAVVTFHLVVEGQEQPFARGGWRFLFTSSEKLVPQEQGGSDFFKHLLVTGVTKITTVLNPLCLHANLPVIPIDAGRMAQAAQTQPQAGATNKQPPASGAGPGSMPIP